MYGYSPGSPIGVSATSAAPADTAVAEALADNAVARLQIGDLRAHLLDDPAPFVAGDAGVPDPASVEDALEHLDVGPADTREPAAYEDVARPTDRGLDLPIDNLVRALDDDRSHGA